MKRNARRVAVAWVMAASVEASVLLVIINRKRHIHFEEEIT